MPVSPIQRIYVVLRIGYIHKMARIQILGISLVKGLRTKRTFPDLDCPDWSAIQPSNFHNRMHPIGKCQPIVFAGIGKLTDVWNP